MRERVLELARADRRVVAGAVIGSLAHGAGDRWSDLDLGFGLASGVAPADVLGDWTRTLEREFAALHLFDLPSRSTVYRVFLFPGYLQVDLSATPASEFGAAGPRFELLFGNAGDQPHAERPSARDLFGLGVHHAVRARICIERDRRWQAQFWIAGIRDEALSLACLRRGLDLGYGRGYDDLPREALEAFEGTLVRSVDRDELLRALSRAIDALLREADDVGELATGMERQLRGLAAR